MTNAYIYQADIYCETCAEEIRGRFGPESADTENSDAWPQGPYSDGGGEADCPQHCDSCGVFLENPLTGEGYDYVREQADDKSSANDVIRQWLEYYDIEL